MPYFNQPGKIKEKSKDSFMKLICAEGAKNKSLQTSFNWLLLA